MGLLFWATERLQTKDQISTPLLVFRPCQCMARTWAILDYVSIEHVFSLFHPQFTAIHSFGAKEFWEISEMRWVANVVGPKVWRSQTLDTTRTNGLMFCSKKKAGGVVGVLIPVMIVRIIDNYSCNDSYVIILIPVNLRTYDSYKL